MNKYTNALWANLCFLFLFFIGFALGQAQYTVVFTKHDIYANANGARLATTADVDGDGDLDVLSASISDDSIRWYENDGSEGFTVHDIDTSADGAYSVTTADVDGDGDMDVLSASAWDDSIHWYENDGSEGFTAHTISTNADSVRSVATADVDGDGDMDVLSASALDNAIRWYENDGSEGFTAHDIYTSAIYAFSVATADVDGDGDMDVLSASSDDNSIRWYENDGSGSFTVHSIFANATGAFSVTTADVDGDGDMDVLSASGGDDSIRWYENDGSESFTARTIYTNADNALSVTTADVDGDGDMDVLSASGGDHSIRWYENDGSESFTARTIYANATFAYSVTTADVDDDGDIDVLSASYSDDSIRWYELELIDDTAPAFTSGTTATSIDENSGAGQIIYTIQATDNVGVTSYAIGGTDASHFSVNATTGAVTLTADPDYETKSSYSFEVVATDAAGNASQQTVTLAINDLNDNAPVFSSGSTASVAEGQTATGYTATATDADAGSTISYSITGGVDHSLFSITGGVLSFSAAPDYESPGDDDGNNDYEVVITATDGTHGTTQTVTVTVTDLNDNAPAFSSGTATVSVAEGQTATGYTATATDADASSTITYSITGGVDHSLFSITGGVLSFSAAPDYEAPGDDDGNNDYEVVITATDGTHGTTQTVTVTVTDVDEIAPAFTSGTTATSIDENSGAGQIIYTIQATDNVGVTSYAIGGTDASHFSVNATTGAVTLTADPDYETKSSYSFEVVATDAAGNASQQTVTLAINDLNDNAPVFSSGSTASVAEGQTATGYTATATDADAGSTISYSITGGVDHSLFSITGGVLSFSAAPDYESPGDDDGNNDYEVVITATDGTHGTPQTVTVTVTDIVDETAPMLETAEASSDGGQIILTLTENVVENGTVNASDFVLTIDHVDSPPTVTNITVSTSTVTLTLNEALSIAPGTNTTLTYTKSENSGTIEDSAGNRLADFSQQSVDVVTLELRVVTKAEILFNNPVRTTLYITSDEKLYQLRIFSIIGRKVLEKGLNTKSQNVDLSTLPAGIYLLELATETHVKRGKLLKM